MSLVAPSPLPRTQHYRALSCEPWTCWVCIPTYRHCIHLCMSICYQNFLGHCQPSPEHLELGGSDWGLRRGTWRKRTFSLELWGVQLHLCVSMRVPGALESSVAGEVVGQHQRLCSAGPCCLSWGMNPVRHQGEVPGRGTASALRA